MTKQLLLVLFVSIVGLRPAGAFGGECTTFVEGGCVKCAQHTLAEGPCDVQLWTDSRTLCECFYWKCLEEPVVEVFIKADAGNDAKAKDCSTELLSQLLEHSDGRDEDTNKALARLKKEYSSLSPSFRDKIPLPLIEVLLSYPTSSDIPEKDLKPLRLLPNIQAWAMRRLPLPRALKKIWFVLPQKNLLQLLDDKNLAIYRNAIFAQHGRLFQDRELREFFESQPWYKPQAGYTDALLTNVDRYNIRAATEESKKRK